MKPVTLHPLSTLAGVVLAGLAFLASSAGAISTTKVVVVGTVPAEQWTYVEIGDGGPNPVPYVVPADKRFVVTRAQLALSNNSLPRLNGLVVDTMLYPVNSIASPDGGNTRVVFQPGDSLSFSGEGRIRYWGYLEPL